MSTFALTSAGLETQTEAEIVDELISRLRSTFGVNLNTSATSIMGQIVRIVAELRAFDQQVLLAAYRSFDPNSAIGQALDRLANLTGTIRKGARASVVSGLFEFSAAGSVSDGDLFRNEDTGDVWEVVGGPYAVGAAGSVAGQLQASEDGPKLANAGTTWSAITVVPALIGFTNPTDDAAPGRLEETDPELRRRRQIEIYAGGLGPRATIRAVVSKIDGENGSVDAVRVDHNPSIDPVDSEGIPFKAFRVAVETTPTTPGVALQDEIAEAIFSVLGVGGYAHGVDYSRPVTDSEGEVETIRFDLIDQVPIYVKIDVSTAGTEQAVSANMAEVIEAAILEYATDNFRDIGRDQIAGEYAAIVWALKQSGQISGPTSVTVSLSRTALIGPYADPLILGSKERPNFDSVNIEATIA